MCVCELLFTEVCMRLDVSVCADVCLCVKVWLCLFFNHTLRCSAENTGSFFFFRSPTKTTGNIYYFHAVFLISVPYVHLIARAVFFPFV